MRAEKMRRPNLFSIIFVVCLAVTLWVTFAMMNSGEEPAEDLGEGFEELMENLLPPPPSATAPDGRRRVIDVHTHLFDPVVWPHIDAVMASQGLDYLVNLSGGSPRRGLTESLLMSAMSENRILNFMTVNWEGVDELSFGDLIAAELELCVTRFGYGGLKVSKALGVGVETADGELLPVNDPRLFPIWEKAGELGVPVFIHTGDPAAFWEPVTPDNERYEELLAHPSWSFASPEYPSRETLLSQREDLLALFPGTVFVGLHFGNNPENIDEIDSLLNTYPNFYVDIAARVPEIGRHPPERVRDLFIRHADRILFGSDIVIGRTGRGRDVLVLGSSGFEDATPEEIPLFFTRHWQFLETDGRDMAHPTPIQGDWTIDGINLPEEVLDRVLFLNAYELVIEPWLTRQATLEPVLQEEAVEEGSQPGTGEPSTQPDGQ